MGPLWFSNGSLVVSPMIPYLVVPHGPIVVSLIFPSGSPNDSLLIPKWFLMAP